MSQNITINTKSRCPWWGVEAGFVYRISPKVLRQAVRAGMTAIDVLIMARAWLREEGSTDSRFLRHAQVRDCSVAMKELIEMRMRVFESCLSFEYLFRIARGYEGNHPHVKECEFCRSELGWIRSELSSLKQEFGALDLA